MPVTGLLYLLPIHEGCYAVLYDAMADLIHVYKLALCFDCLGFYKPIPEVAHLGRPQSA